MVICEKERVSIRTTSDIVWSANDPGILHSLDMYESISTDSRTEHLYNRIRSNFSRSIARGGELRSVIDEIDV